MAEVIVYVTGYCPYCHAAKDLLADKGVSFTEVDVTGKPGERALLRTRAEGRSTVPQIFISGIPIGGYDELAALERAGELDPLLEKT
ncbi:MAG: glutaredoxin 3 [Candidatus Binatia bacterium]|nr:glutaredoxin 3 [Candidatus Binatia bacterium]MDG1957707.1 glutaredoxin 3 [Candidatus Binatia bacterium]MDG2010852.1 glutaredoxin 3 [Candidatus Binatia bacterium]